MSRFDYCSVIPITVQNIMLEHMEAQGMSKDKASKALIGIASEMKQWNFIATNKKDT